MQNCTREKVKKRRESESRFAYSSSFYLFFRMGMIKRRKKLGEIREMAKNSEMKEERAY